MAEYIDRETREFVLAREVESDEQIAVWLHSRNALPLPEGIYAKPPHIAPKGHYVVMLPVEGRWTYETFTPLQFDKRFERVDGEPTTD